MAAIHELLKQVSDPALRARLTEEFDRVTQNKKFGLVFEEHMPECTPLYGIGIKRGATVAKKANKINDTYTVIKVNDDTAVCRNKSTGDAEEIAVADLVAVAEFGDAIFPCLQPIDKVENAPDSDLWHTLIEADNYHALQLLEYLYAGKVDCIYIDPPYNTGAKDWKYNNDYVDGSDSYRHSKWLSMMKKRLKLAKRLLNPEDSVLIVTIDEKEYLHLGCLLEEMFPEANIQMISSRINATGIIRLNEFTRVDEYIFFVMLGKSMPQPIPSMDVIQEKKMVQWHGLRRRDAESMRGTAKGGVAQFYPIFVNDSTCTIEKIGEALPHDMNRHTVTNITGCTTVFPLKPDGTEMNWGLIGPVLEERLRKGYVRVKKGRGNSSPYSIEYLTSGYVNDIEAGKAVILGYEKDGSVIAEYTAGIEKTPLTSQWNNKYHYAKEYGTGIIKAILGGKRFSYPKSIYAVEDCIKSYCLSKKDALIVDFFAGSGTTLHAVNLLNAEDGGHRRCILVTNNEVSESEAKDLTKKGYRPGDEEWEKLGIARYVTWPRTVCSIEGHDVNGKPLKGNYLGSDLPMADGFAANCEYFKLGFLDRDMVSLGRQFQEILPLLWMKSGAVGKRPEIDEEEPVMLVLPENHFAVLVEDAAYAAFAREVKEFDSIDTVYFVTNSEAAFHEMSADIGIKNTYQLYRDYIDNFVIGARRDRT